MKYPWVAISIIGVWLGSAIAIWAREDIKVENILLIAMLTTLVIAFIGFRTPHAHLPT
ncbi:hypothetical protein HY406_00625 [Candidatus Giovannonibacteria bacterium]|nr:hypothetical protein [Candidatus Giovannonibacteria bacterium]